jgi:hypothetical protein
MSNFRHPQFTLLDPAIHHAGINAVLLDHSQETIEALPQFL